MMPQPSKHPGSRLIRHIQRRSGTAILFSGQLPAADEMPTAVPVSQSQPGNTAQRSQMPMNGLRTVTTAAPHPHSAGTSPNNLGATAVQRASMTNQAPAASTASPANWSTSQRPAPHSLAQRSGPVLTPNHVPGYSPTSGAAGVQRQLPPAGAPILRQTAAPPAQVSDQLMASAGPVKRQAAPTLRQTPAGGSSVPPTPATLHPAGFPVQRQTTSVLRQQIDQPTGLAASPTDHALASSGGDAAQRQAYPANAFSAHAVTPPSAQAQRYVADPGNITTSAGQASPGASHVQRQPQSDAIAPLTPTPGRVNNVGAGTVQRETAPTEPATAPAGHNSQSNSNLQRQPTAHPVAQAATSAVTASSLTESTPTQGENSGFSATSGLATGTAGSLQREVSTAPDSSPATSGPAPDTAPASSAASERGAQLAVFRAESKEGLSKNWGGISADRQWEVLQRVKAIGEKYAQRREAEKAQEAAAAEAAPAEPERPTRLMRRSQVIEVGTSKGIPSGPIDLAGAGPVAQRQAQEEAPANPAADSSPLVQRSAPTNGAGSEATDRRDETGPPQTVQAPAATDAVQRRSEASPFNGLSDAAKAPIHRQTTAAANQPTAQAAVGATVQRERVASAATPGSNRPVTIDATPGQPAIHHHESRADFVTHGPTTVQRLANTTPPGQSEPRPGSAIQRQAETGGEAGLTLDQVQAVQAQTDNSRPGPSQTPPPLQRATTTMTGISAAAPHGAIQPVAKQPTAASSEPIAPTGQIPAVQREMPAPSSAVASPVQLQSDLNGGQPLTAVSPEIPEAAIGRSARPGARSDNTMTPAAGLALARAADPATLVEAVPPGGPTGSSIQFVPPTRPRPTAAQRQPSQRPPEAPTQSAAPDIPTEFGPLPADLWRHVGVEPPQPELVSSSPSQPVAQRAPLEEALFGDADLTAEPELNGMADFAAPAAPDLSTGPGMKAGAATMGTGRLTITENEDSLQAPAPVILEPGEGQAAMEMFAEQPELASLAPAQTGSSDAGIPVFASSAEAEKVAANPVPVTLSDQAAGASFTVFTDADRLDELGNGAEPENSDGVLAVYADEDQAAEMFANPVELFCQLPGEKGRFRVFADADRLDDLRLAADTLEEGGLLQAFASERDAADNFAAVSRILLKDETSQTVYFGFADREALADFLSTAEQHEAEHLINGLARQVYQGLQRQFELERERRGGRLGR